MKESSVYRVGVESVVRGPNWEGVFSEVPDVSNITEAIQSDIMNLNPTVEHEADRIVDYGRLKEVVRNVDMMSDSVEVLVADVRIGVVTVTEEQIFIN